MSRRELRVDHDTWYNYRLLAMTLRLSVSELFLVMYESFKKNPKSHPAPSKQLVRKVKAKNEFTEKIELIYSEIYPRKEGKAKGMAILSKTITGQELLDKFEQAVKNYANHVDGQDYQFKKIFSSFANCWEDYADKIIKDDAISYSKEDDLKEMHKNGQLKYNFYDQ